MISLPYYTIQISGTHLLANHLRKISFTITIKHLTSMIVCYAQQKTEVLDRYKTMFLAIIGDNQPFLLRVLRKSFCFPRTTAAFTIILNEKILVKLLGGSHLKTGTYYLTGRYALTFMINLVIIITIFILVFP